MRERCGIPQLTLLGKAEDWAAVAQRIHAIDELGIGLTWWTSHLHVIISQFSAAASGEEVSPHFWQRMYKTRRLGDARYFDGWIGCLFPYVLVEGRGLERNVLLQSEWGMVGEGPRWMKLEPRTADHDLIDGHKEGHPELAHVTSWLDVAPTRGVTNIEWRRGSTYTNHDRQQRAIKLESCPLGQTTLSYRVHGDPEEAIEGPQNGGDRGEERKVSKWREGEVWRRMCKGAAEHRAARQALTLNANPKR